MIDQPAMPGLESQRQRNIQARQEAQRRIDQAEANAARWWKTQAELAIRLLARGGVVFTANDVWDLLARQGTDEPHDRRALGALLRNAVRQGTVEWTGGYALNPNGSPIRQWKGQTP